MAMIASTEKKSEMSSNLIVHHIRKISCAVTSLCMASRCDIV